MIRRILPLLVATLLVASTLLAGCSRQTANDPAQAKAILTQWLQALKANKSQDVYANLSPTARKYISSTEAATYLSEARSDYGEIGQPETVASGWVRIPVKSFALGEPHYSIQWPELRITMQYDAGRWWVASALPLWDDAMLAYNKQQYDNELNVAKQMAEIDPYFVHAFVEQYFAFHHLKQDTEAEGALQQALQVADPADKPDVIAITARLRLEQKKFDEAITRANEALSLAKPYLGSFYSPRWQSNQLVLIGSAYLGKADVTQASKYATDALGAAADNQDAVTLLQAAAASKP